MGSISYRMGKSAAPSAIAEQINGRKDPLQSNERLQSYLYADGVDLDKIPAILGPMLTMDSATDCFTGDFAESANKLSSPGLSQAVRRTGDSLIFPLALSLLHSAAPTPMAIALA